MTTTAPPPIDVVQAIAARARADGRLRVGSELASAAGTTHALQCDVVIVGSGAGGAVLAAGLAERGLDVVVLEAGGYFTSADFDLQEGHALPMLYQDRGTRATVDMAINVLQGRSVGGSTTVNWTTCYRTPPAILRHWQTRHGLAELTEAELAPHFAAVERRLSISPWPKAQANANNRRLLDGAHKLGWQADGTARNVRGCANSGYCGLGCPVDGKQAMGITYLSDLLGAGGRLYADCRVVDVDVGNDGRARGVNAEVVDRDTGRATGATVSVQAKVVVLSGGAINTPALLLRSRIAGGPVGERTFIHPVVGVAGVYTEKIAGYYGAPQSIASHQFIDRGPDKLGFFMEAAPVQPMLIAFASGMFGAGLHSLMAQLPYVSVLIALFVDGLRDDEPGGTVTVDAHGRSRLDYPLGPLHTEAFAAMHDALARVQLAAGAKHAMTLHRVPITVSGERDLPSLAAAAFGAHEHSIFTAHQMGGAAMGADAKTSVVRQDLRHHRVANLFVVDGSVMPTALGVNPSESIYGLAHRATSAVAAAVTAG